MSDKYVVTIDNFDGPLDLLLHLIKEQDIDIYDIKIEDITKQYLDYIRHMKELNLEIASEYLVMASELIEMKSKMLLPKKKEKEDDDYEEDPRELLIERLLAYKRYKEVTSEFKDLELTRKMVFTREPDNLNRYVKEDENSEELGVADLIDAFNNLLKRKELDRPIATKITKKELSVTEKVNKIKNILRNKKKINFEDIFEGLLFVTGDDGLSLEDVVKLLEVSKDEALKLLEQYKKSLEFENRGLKLVYLGNKYKLTTKEEHKKYYELLVDKTVSGSLSQSALETLAIIAYNEPITVGQIDEIRGVSSRDMVRKLLFKGLIDVAGKSDLPGKPMLYKTTNKFLDYFNLSSKDELPEINMNEEISEEEKDLFISRYKEEKK